MQRCWRCPLWSMQGTPTITRTGHYFRRSTLRHFHDCIIGIETSCDDTAVAVLSFPRGNNLLGPASIAANVIAGQTSVHRPHGGIVPRLAARAHDVALPLAIDAALREAGIVRGGGPRERAMAEGSPPSSAPTPGMRVIAVAVTAGPGLFACLDVGIRAAGQLAAELGVPLLPVNHLDAHLLLPRMPVAPKAAAAAPGGLGGVSEVSTGPGRRSLHGGAGSDAQARTTPDGGPAAAPSPLPFPYLVLLASGGHTLLAVTRGVGQCTTLASTLDDALGEAFDKVARLLGAEAALAALGGRPGDFTHAGAVLEALAAYGDPGAVSLPVPLRKPPVSQHTVPCAFSFAGLKSAISRFVGREGVAATLQAQPQLAANIAAAFQATAAEHVCDQLRRAAAYTTLASQVGPSPPAAPRHVVLCGGVAANAALRLAVSRCAGEMGLVPVFPPPALCTDNGVMVAWAALERLRATAVVRDSGAVARILTGSVRSGSARAGCAGDGSSAGLAAAVECGLVGPAAMARLVPVTRLAVGAAFAVAA